MNKRCFMIQKEKRSKQHPATKPFPLNPKTSKLKVESLKFHHKDAAR